MPSSILLSARNFYVYKCGLRGPSSCVLLPNIHITMNHVNKCVVCHASSPTETFCLPGSQQLVTIIVEDVRQLMQTIPRLAHNDTEAFRNNVMRRLTYLGISNVLLTNANHKINIR